MSKIDSSAQAQVLASKLWEIANELRGTMDASKFKNYILGTIFYRYLSEHTERYLNEQLVNDELTYEEAFPCDDYHDELIACSLS
ncbi:MAG: type I restriction-modification system subunit M N-terminal domain-containing protein, partial [Anaerobiospirillum sp.]|nr:type I restriction-modification system subunit M N-terminal domain-containing protein [Anaerobiospirillum sp.]